MMPIGPLMIEHRITERMISLMKEESGEMEAGRVDLHFVEATVDFFRTYVDLCHHGKEEAILFRSLDHKDISHEHRKIMDELIEEHELARRIIARLERATERYAEGDLHGLTEMRNEMEEMTVLYPDHIRKEDKHFFVPSMGYFSQAEQSAMLSEMTDFDRQMIHKVYRGVVERLETRKTS